jgi:hypothetical protein
MDVDALLRGDIKSRYEAFALARQWGFKSINDIRRKTNDSPIPGGGGDDYLVPLNMAPADKLMEILMRDKTTQTRARHAFAAMRNGDASHVV